MSLDLSFFLSSPRPFDVMALTTSSAGYVDPESDGSLEEDLASRRYRALLPDDDDYDSDDF